MIRHRNTNHQARRIAVVEIPRSPETRLGRIGSIRDYDWTLVPSVAVMNVEPYAPQQPFTATGQRDMTPRTSSAWMAEILARQANQRESTPGTLTWTPTPTPKPNISAPWNSWAGPCPPAAVMTSTTAAPDDASTSGNGSVCGQVPRLFCVAAGLAGLASVAYMLNTLFSGKGN